MSLNPGLSRDRFFFYKDTRLNVTDYLYRRYSTLEKGWGGVSTSGASTTITGDAGLDVPPFANVNGGDILTFRLAGVTSIRKVVTKVSNNQVTVDSAITLTSCSSWRFYKTYSGITNADGWLDIGQEVNRTIFFDVESLGESVAGIDVTVEGKSGHGLAQNPITIFSVTITNFTYGASGTPINPLTIGEDYRFIRVGVKAHTSIPTDPDVFSIWAGTRDVR